MQKNKLLDLLKSVQKWHSGETGIAEVILLLGDEHNELGSALVTSGVCDFGYRIMEEIDYQTLVNAILLYLAMRQPNLLKADAIRKGAVRY